jgi:glutamate racemase
MSGRIGIFDSGVGGLSVLRALHERMPRTPMIYVGDVAHAPFGERPAAQVIDRCQRLVEYFVGRGVRLIVVACNTATSLAIEQIRQRWPMATFIGVEPGVKPAAEQSRTGRIAIMATPTTIRSLRLRRLIERYAAHLHVHLQECPGLAGAIERGVFDGAELDGLLAPACEAIRAQRVDTVVLGCTHYPFVARSIRRLLGSEVTLLDTADAVARRAASLLAGTSPDAAFGIEVFSTGQQATMRQLIARCPALAKATVKSLTL